MAITYNNEKVNPVGIAAIGAGNWGQNLFRNFASMPNSHLLYIADKSERVQEKIAKSVYPMTCVTDELEKILNDSSVNAVVIATEAPLFSL